MQKQVQRLAMVAALAIGAAALSVTPARATPTAQDQDHRDQSQHPEYSNNRYYQLGNREGLQDHRKNMQRKAHNHSYKTDVDKRAHDDGYQQGWQGQNYRDNHRDPHLK